MERSDFAAFFAALNDGCGPFRWQERLLDCLLKNGRWPDQIAAPTGAGKTSGDRRPRVRRGADRRWLRAAACRAATAMVVDRRVWSMTSTSGHGRSPPAGGSAHDVVAGQRPAWLACAGRRAMPRIVS
jgi:hypothetical protein